MTAKKTSSKKRAQGGGRTANSEPRYQVFQQFGGCNFELSPHDFTLGTNESRMEQSDLQMNFVVVENNVFIASNKSMETRNNIVKLFQAPDNYEFTKVCLLKDDQFFIGCAKNDASSASEDDSLIYYASLGDGFLDDQGFKMTKQVVLDAKSSTSHTWECLDYYDDKLIAATKENRLWMGDIETEPVSISDAKLVPNPSSLTMDDLVGKKKLSISQTTTDDCVYRIDLAYTYVNKYGPTKVADRITFYADKAVDEWSAAAYLQVNGTIPSGYDIEAVELYYCTDNASSLIFLDRVDVSSTATSWTYKWYGYLDATTMWTVGNLVAPTENYTEGAPVSHMTNIDGRMYFWGDNDMPERLYIGGNPGNLFSVANGTGGGYVDAEPGTGQVIRYVDKYKTQSGNSIVSFLTDAPNTMREQRFNLVENTITISNEQNMKSWQAEQIAGAVGCKSYYGAKVCEDGLYSVSRYGLALTTLTMEYNSQIRANYVSDAIKPAFVDSVNLAKRLKNSVLLECDGIIYLTFGKSVDDDKSSEELDNLMFCYDIDAKAWWTYTLDVDEPILMLVHIDYEGCQEGIGIVTPNTVYMLPTTVNDDPDDEATFEFLIETGELSSQQPQQGWVYLSQIEFRFDYFLGDMDVDLTGVDMFGREVHVHKDIVHTSTLYNSREYMRVDLRLQSYKLTFSGTARFRMSHFIGKVYTLSNKIGLVWGFDDRMSCRSSGDIHPTFKCYNDIRDAIFV